MTTPFAKASGVSIKPGQLQLFCWTSLVTAVLMVFAMPSLTVATLMLAADRYAGMHFFTDAAGGNMMNFVNLFWLFGRPEVYILVLPAFGVYSEVISALSSKEFYGYISLVIATCTIGLMSFTVWLHHFFTMGGGVVIGISGLAVAFGLVWHIWWLVSVFMPIIALMTIGRSFLRNTTNTIPAAEVEAFNRRWLAPVRKSTPVPRQLEMTAANERLAKWMA